MKYGIYNDELGYGLGPEYNDAFDAVLAAWDKCRRHHVVVFDDDGKFIRNMTQDEEVSIYDERKNKYPATRICYVFPAKTPLAKPENEASNWNNIIPFKELAIRFCQKFGGIDSKIGCVYTDLPMYLNAGNCGIAVQIDYTMDADLRKKFDRLAKKMQCPVVYEYNKFSVRTSVKSYSK